MSGTAVNPYVLRAVRVFLHGTDCRTPEEAVRLGKRTLTEWCAILQAERAREGRVDALRSHAITREVA